MWKTAIDPFKYLGPHTESHRTVVRACLPNLSNVDDVDKYGEAAALTLIRNRLAHADLSTYRDSTRSANAWCGSSGTGMMARSIQKVVSPKSRRTETARHRANRGPGNR